MKNQKYNSKTFSRSAFTLIEILVVISVLVIISALVIPRIRTISKDRNIRETARVVGSTISSASQRAQTNGVAGVEFVRNTNFEDASYAPGGFACTQMYTLRSIPAFTGDDDSSKASIVTGGGGTQVFMRLPLEHEVDEPICQIGDKIRFNHRSIEYVVISQPVVDIANNQLSFFIGNRGIYPFPPATVASLPAFWNNATTYNANDPVIFDGELYASNINGNTNQVPSTSASWRQIGLDFHIRRRPVRMDSSLITLPAGYYIDLRYTDAGTGQFHPTGDLPLTAPQFSALDTQFNIEVLFNRSGGIETVYGVPTGAALAAADPQPPAVVPLRDMRILVVEDNVKLPPGTDNLDQATNLWVTVKRSNGGVGVNYNIPPGTTLTNGNNTNLQTRLQQSRTITTTASQAVQ